MKLSPVAPGAPKAVNPNEGMSASADRMARAKAVASGQAPEAASPTSDPQVARAESSMKRIKLRTQVSPDRHNRVEEAPKTAVPATAEGATAVAGGADPTNPVAPGKSDTLDQGEQANPASEDTKPLSPQFAALAKQKREIQLAQQKLDADKAALAAQSTGTKSLEEYRARIKANALSVLMEEGVTYDQLTEQILASNQENADLSSLKAEVKALKDGLENQSKSLTDRDAAAEAQAKAQIRRNVDQLIAQGDDYEMVREAGYAPKVVDLIEKVYRAEGILLDEAEAASIIEKELLEESLKFAKIKKVQSRLNPAPPSQQTQPVQTDRPGTKVMRTLTNRDGASSLSMSKRERAIAAMEGRILK